MLTGLLLQLNLTTGSKFLGQDFCVAIGSLNICSVARAADVSQNVEVGGD